MAMKSDLERLIDFYGDDAKVLMTPYTECGVITSVGCKLVYKGKIVHVEAAYPVRRGNVNYAAECARNVMAKNVMVMVDKFLEGKRQEEELARLEAIRKKEEEEEIARLAEITRMAEEDLRSKSVLVHAIASDYARLLNASEQAGWKFAIETLFEPVSGIYTLRCLIGSGKAPSAQSLEIDEACSRACALAIKYCQGLGINIPEDAPEAIWHEPLFIISGDEDIANFLAKATLFPVVDNNGTAPISILYAAVPGKHVGHYEGSTPLLESKVGAFTIYGAEINSDLILSTDYTLVPIGMDKDSIWLPKWTAQVSGNSVELALWANERGLSGNLTMAFSGAIVEGDKITGGSVDVKTLIVEKAALRLPYGTNTGDQNVIALLARYGPYNVQQLKFTVPIIAGGRVGVPAPVEFVEAMVRRGKVVMVKPKPATTVVTTRKPSGASTTTVTKSVKGVGPVVVEKLVNTPKKKMQMELINVSTDGYTGKIARGIQQPLRPMHDQILDYTRAIVDPFNVQDGVKVPDLIIYPSTTFCVHQRFDITADSSGNIAIAAFPWFRQMVYSTNFNNTFASYDWKNAVVKDAAQLGTIENGYTMVRPVAMGFRVIYTGSALNAQGTFIGALTDPGQPLPGNYEAMAATPEYSEYSISAESAGVEVIHKPMTLYNLEYKNVGQWVTPANMQTTWWSAGAAVNASSINDSAWLKPLGNNVATMERNDWPFVVVAGKGLQAGAPIMCEIKIHFEATVRSSTLSLGAVKPSAPTVSSEALNQAAAVMAKLPAVRKPGSNVIGKVTGIVRGLNDVVREGFNLAGTVKKGLTTLI